MRKIIGILGIMIVLGVGFGLYMYNKPVSSTKGMKSSVDITATELLNQYAGNEQSANERFLDKIIRVSGNVKSVEEENGVITVALETEDMLSSVLCEMENDEKIDDISPGQEIILKGICSGYLMDVILVRCVIDN